jgi:phosphatidylserine/phosphatidylglycerophosphate/cardiolipin synthase-like enzyme
VADTPEAREDISIKSSIFIKKPYPHIKLLIVDDEIVFIGSTNFTQNALDNNREV